MTRIQAFTTHLITSLAVVCVVAVTALWIWYPDFYASANDIWRPLSIMIGVDAILGPVMMLILFKPGKPGLKFDITVILAIQIMALTGATGMMFLESPKLAVYHNGMFVCLSANNVKAAHADPSQFQADNTVIPQAYLPFPNPQQQAEWQQRLNVMPNGQLSFPPYVFGDYFESITPQNIATMLRQELDVSVLSDEKHLYHATWQAFVSKHKDNVQNYAYFSMVCSPTEHLAVMDRKTGILIDAIPIPSLNIPKKYFSQSN